MDDVSTLLTLIVVIDFLFPRRTKAQHRSPRNTWRTLRITWQDRVPNEIVLDQAGINVMFALLTERHEEDLQEGLSFARRTPENET